MVWPAAIVPGRTVSPAGGSATVTVIGPLYPLRRTVTPTLAVPPRGTLTCDSFARSSKSGRSGSTTIRYGNPIPPRFSRSRITRVISFVPPGMVRSSDGSGVTSVCACWPVRAGCDDVRIVGVRDHRAVLAQNLQDAVERRAEFGGFHPDPQPLARRRRRSRIDRLRPADRSGR